MGALGVIVAAPPIAFAQSAGAAPAFVKQTADQLVEIVNGPGTPQEKRPRLLKVIDSAVDVEGIARFCLGAFWQRATPEQQREYIELFHDVLLNNITGKLGDYRGVAFTMGRTTPRGETDAVNTLVTRPNAQPANVDWIVSNAASNPKVVDVVAEGTSLRLTQRSDYASYLHRNNNSVAALIEAMRHQVASFGSG
ncbi:MAG: ABC transporter substrate-binding protein [Acetobacteraceae bacterium]|nr:ABC transporter substrate-binding protein [Acetobacteraceae bacterium]